MKNFFAQNSPAAQRARKRIGNLRPMRNPESKAKLSRTLKKMGWRPPVHGGNGRPMPEPQRLLLAALGSRFIPEFPVTIPDSSNHRGHYLIDLAYPHGEVAVEVDGRSHNTVKQRRRDRRKDRILRKLGWKVFRFSNQEVLSSPSSVAEQIRSRSMI